MRKCRFPAQKFSLTPKVKISLVCSFFTLGAKDQLRQSNLNAGGNYEQNKQINVEGGYQPSDYANLPVGMEVKELFKSIQRYIPKLL